MTHRDTLTVFKANFEELSSKLSEWFPNGKDSIRIRLANRQEIIFTYHGEKDWNLETVNNYINRIKGEKRQ